MRQLQLHQIIALTKLKSKTCKRMRQTLFKAKIELYQNMIKVPGNIYRWHKKKKKKKKKKPDKGTTFHILNTQAGKTTTFLCHV